MSATFYTSLQNLLSEIDGLTGGVHLGAVDDDTVTSGGYVLPYCVIWTGAGSTLDDVFNEPVAGGPSLRGGRQLRFSTIVAAASPLHALHAADDVTRALTGTTVTGGLIRPDLDQQNSVVVDQEPSSRPARYYLPLEWTTQLE